MADPPALPSTSSGTGAVATRVLRQHRGLAEHLAEIEERAWDAVDPVILELCRLRVAMLLGCDPESVVRKPTAVAAGLSDDAVADLASWPTSVHFDVRQRACLALCEQFVIDVAGTTDELRFDVAAHLGGEGLVDFVKALLVVEQRQRLRLAWDRLLDDGGPE